jgi:nitrous oxidase accessory protein
MFSHDNLFEANAFTYSAAGSSIMNSRGVVARGNLFAFHRGVGGYGLLQQTTEGTVLERNRFVGNAVGLFLDGAADAVIRDNLVADNHVGLQLFPSTVRATITGNAIVANSLTAAGAAPDSRFCAGERGNYWSDDDGWDLDRDGVHDVAYEAVSPLTVLSQHRPALRLFLASPAATVLAWAERALPVFDVTGVRDACPLARLPDGVPTLGADLPAAARRAGEAYAVAGAALGAGLLLAGLGTRRKENE